MKKKLPVSYRFSEESIAILKDLSHRLGLTQTSVLEYVIRQYIVDHPEQWHRDREEPRRVAKRL